MQKRGDIDGFDAGGLDRFMASFDRDGAYRVDEVLKQTPFETTQVVYFPGSDGSELGPFIRKYIAAGEGTGLAYERLWRAQRSGARMAHLPRILECRVEAERLVVVMEYIEGETVEGRVAREGASCALALAVMPAVCDAVGELHGAFRPPLIHRDLKPSNIILTGGAGEGGAAAAAGDDAGIAPTAVIIDLGIARSFKPGAEADTARFGTRGYAAPEQFGFGQTDVRTDVYALGAICAFICTGVQPTGAIDSEGLVRAGVPAGLADAIARATAFDPKMRFLSAEAFRAALLAAASESEALGPAPMPDGGRPAAPAPVAETPPASSVPSAPPGSAAAAAPASSRGLAASLSRLVPAWLGRAWNILLAALFAITAAASVSVLASPTGETARNPAWYNAAIVLLLILPVCALNLLLFADRRRMGRLPVMGRPTAPKIIAWMLGWSVAAVLLLALLMVFE